MNFNPNYLSGLATAIAQSSVTEQTLTNQLSSGLRVTQLSDDPVAVSANVGLASSISRLDSFVQSSNTQEGGMQVADTALGEVVSQVTKAMSLAINAGNGTMSSAQLTSVQTQVASLRDAVVSMANTSYQGQYLFAGSQGNTKPFSVDTSTDPATATYHGDSVVQTTTTPDGQQVPVNLAGSNVFMAQSSNLLGTLNKLVSDLGNAASSAAAGATDVTAVVADSTALNSALGTVSAQRATLDSSLARLQTANTYASSQSANYTAQQSALLSADPATLATDLKTAEVQQQALLGVTSTLEGQQNLFTYLKGG